MDNLDVSVGQRKNHYVDGGALVSTGKLEENPRRGFHNFEGSNKAGYSMRIEEYEIDMPTCFNWELRYVHT